MALLTDGFNPFGASSAFLTGLGLALWASRSLTDMVNVGWLALCVCNLLASAAVLLSMSFFWGSLAFFAPRAAEEINTPLLRMFDHLKLFPLDGLSGVMRNGLLTVVPVGFVAWYPCRALLGHAPAWYAAANGHTVQHAGQRDVVDVQRLTGDFVPAFLARHILTNEHRASHCKRSTILQLAGRLT